MFEEILACCCITVRLSPENVFVGYSWNVVICLLNLEAASEGFLTLVIINLTEQTGNRIIYFFKPLKHGDIPTIIILEEQEKF